MDIEYFIKLLKKKIRKVADDDLIVGNKNDMNRLKCFEWTYLFSIALYQTVKHYNSHRPQKSHLFISPETGGRTATDFALKNYEGMVALAIEHENFDTKIISNYQKLLERGRGTHRLQVCYIKDEDIDDTIEELRNLKKKLRKNKKFHLKKKVHLLIGEWEREWADGSDLQFIHKIV